MGFFHHEKSDEAQAYEQVKDGSYKEHDGSKMHEVLAAGASFYAAREYEKKYGKEGDHAFAKEALAGLAGAFIDHEVETRGLNEVDKLKAKHEAKKKVHQDYDAQN